MLRCFFLCSVFIFLAVIPSLAKVNIDTTQNASLKAAQIEATYDSIVKNNRYVNKLDSSTFFNLPVGMMTGNNANPSYAIMINKVSLQPSSAIFTAGMLLTNPLDGTKLAFEAQNITFSYKGGLSGNIRLALVNTAKINICKDVDLFFLPGTFIEWDCNGFKSLKIKGEVRFKSSTFLPADENGVLKADTSKLTAFIETEVKDLNDLSLTISISPFQIKGVPDLTFSCQNLVIDYSDFTNPEAIKFPANYLSTYSAQTQNLWRGIYIGNASIILGPKFQSKKTKKAPSFSAKDLIIDDQGITGVLSANNLLTLDDGNLGGWDFSLASLSVKLLTSKINEASFSGEVHIPVMKDKQNLTYNAIIDVGGKYNFTVSPSTNIDFDVFGNSKLTLSKNSSINILVDGDNFLPTALLSGKMLLNASVSATDTSANAKADSTKNLKVAEVEFQEMRLSTVEPIFDVKYFAVSGLSQVAFAAFPISIDKISLQTLPGKAKLSLTVKVNLMKSSDAGFGGSTTLTVVASRDKMKFKYDHLEVDAISIDAVQPGFEIHGAIAFAKDDPTYGNGFKGFLDATFGENIQVTATALFGKVKGMRYYFVDALLAIKPGIQAGPLTFYGFGGGLYYHMKQKVGAVDKSMNSFGSTPSGLIYVPTDSISLGIMAEVKFGVIKEQLIDADAKFEIVFNSSGGLNRIGFNGNAKCIVPGVDIVPEQIKASASKLAGSGKLDFAPTDAALSVNLLMNMDFENHIFHAEMEAFVNVGTILKGVGTNGSAGKCVMHIEPTKWYIHIGTPSNPLGIKFLGMMETKTYFMVGHEIPTDLPLNPIVASILKISPDNTVSDNNVERLKTGNGIAFGSSMSINTGDLSFACFYAKFEIGAGFDILLANFGTNAYCNGGQPAPIGINGWYAKGQAYAYLDGSIGIQVKVFGRKKKFEILTIGAAALLHAEGPNPLYVEGQAGGYFSILGGAVNGECKFKVTYGTKCDIVTPVKTSPLQDFQMISSVTPQQDSKAVDVFVLPQAVFNVPIQKSFEIIDDNGLKSSYRAGILKCELKANGQFVPGVKEWNIDNTTLVFKPTDILFPNAKYTYEVVIDFEQSQNGNWVPVKLNDTIITERRFSAFTTGDLPSEIPNNLISYSYPVIRQYNFYPNEYSESYIAFNRGLAPYFNPGDKWSQQARFSPIGGGTALSSAINYNTDEHIVKFPIPTNLTTDKIYSLELVNIPTSATNIDQNVTVKSTDMDMQGDSSKVQLQTREANGSISKMEDKAFLSYGFRCSKFKTLTEKLNFSELTANMLYDISPYVYHLQSTIYGTEMFDNMEINGGADGIPLIRRTAILDQSPWYLANIEPVIYKDYPLLGKGIIDWRTTSTLGIPPTGEIKIWQYNFDHNLTDEEYSSGIASGVSTWAHFMYGLPYNWSNDYYSIRMNLANTYPSMTNPDTHVDAILKKVIWPVISQGNYPVKFEYVLPGIHKVTSTKTITIKDPFSIVQPGM